MKKHIKMKKITLLLLLFIGYGAIAQQIDITQPLPSNSRIKKGVLPNGMTYYIYKTDVTKNVASYYIMQNVGSVLEQENQRGLAHFLEHMAFNGTENFPGKGILNTLEKQGAVFGKDINAYTSFDETVYNMNNIPTKDGLIDTSLLVLHDWANSLLLTDKEIDAERGVIKEEWRTRQNGRMRILEQQFPVLFNKTIYEKRMPIGLMSVVENFDYKALRDFYHNWYRTDLQAIAVIGDIDVDQIERKIKALFSKIPAVKNPLPRTLIEIPNNTKMLYSLGMDAEISTANITFSIRHKKNLQPETGLDLKTSLVNNMLTSLISLRLQEITQQPTSPFLYAGFSYAAGYNRMNESLSLNIAPKPGKQQEAFKSALTEVVRAVKYGFSESELNRIKAQFTSYYEAQLKNIDDLPHGRIQRIMQSNYLENAAMTDPVKEYELVKEIFKTLQPSDLKKQLQTLYTKENRSLLVTGITGKNNLTEQQALQIITDVENDKSIVALQDDFAGKTLLGGLKITKGSIANTTKNTTINATTFTLSNGVKVHYKFTNKNKNQVVLSGRSQGGKSLISDRDIPSADQMRSLVAMSGLGDYSATDLSKVNAGKNAAVNISVGQFYENVSGYSVTKDVETMLQLFYLRFMKPRFDKDSYSVLINNLNNSLLSRSKNVNAQMSDSINVSLYGDDNLRQRLFNKAYIDDVSFDRMQTLYKERFGNIADFEFFIVGDVPQAVLTPLLEKYVASIPSNTQREVWKDTAPKWLHKSTSKEIFIKMQNPKSIVRLALKNKADYSLKGSYVAKALKDILTLRFTETLREEEGGTYGASVSAILSKEPKEELMLVVAFDCNPNKVEELVAIVHSEINKLANGSIKDEDLAKSITNYTKEYRGSQDYNSFDLNTLTSYYRDGVNMSDTAAIEKMLNSITKRDIQQLAKQLLKSPDGFQFIFKPKMEKITD